MRESTEEIMVRGRKKGGASLRMEAVWRQARDGLPDADGDPQKRSYTAPNSPPLDKEYFVVST